MTAERRSQWQPGNQDPSIEAKKIQNFEKAEKRTGLAVN